MPDITIKKPVDHHFLLGDGFVTLDTLGSVLIVSVPALPPKGSVASNVIATKYTEHLEPNTENNPFSKVATGESYMLTEQLKDTEEVRLSSKLKSFDGEEIFPSKFPKCYAQKEHRSSSFVLQTSVLQQELTERCEIADDVPGDMGIGTSAILADQSRGTLKDMELSPRLIHFIEEGIVPESPIIHISQYSSKVDEMVFVSCTPEYDRPDLQDDHPYLNIDDKKTDGTSISVIVVDSLLKEVIVPPCQVSPRITKFSIVSLKEDMNVHAKELKNLQNSTQGRDAREVSRSPVNKEIHTPIANSLNSSSEDWLPNSDEVLKSLQQVPRYKRLRKF